MSATASVARAVVGAKPVGTLNQKTLNFAIMEFLLNQDSNSIKRLWQSHGFSDISPIWGKQSNVPTFKNDSAVISQWPAFQEEMRYVEADWYYLSGHHGRQFEADIRDHDDTRQHVNEQQFVGFFNEHYHHGPWDHASAADPKAHAGPHDVYMTMTWDEWVYDLEPKDNPLFSAPHTNCKGVMLVGCNTLVYKHVRLKLNEYFPNALIIGLLSTENNSISKILKVSQKYGRKLFTNPETIDPVQLTRDLNPFVASVDNMAVMKGGTLYYMLKGNVAQKSATEGFSATEW
jgi:hypothetical protein